MNNIDILFDDFNKPNYPGFALAIIQDGNIICEKYMGMANIELKVPISKQSVFNLASDSKQFTAAAIELLIEEKKVNINDDIRKYIPNFPDYGKTITIDHLIHHTSGIRDFREIGSYGGRKAQDLWTNDEIFHMIVRQKNLNFNPGEQFIYSNSGYFLLGLIVKQVTGMSLKEYAAKHIFQVLGMKQTVIKDDARQLVDGIVSGYSLGTEGVSHDFHNVFAFGSSNVHSYIEDLYIWDQNFYQNQLGKKHTAFIERLYKRGKLTTGKVLNYASGLVHEKYKGLQLIRHGGATQGSISQMIRIPQHHFSIIYLSNLFDFRMTTKLYEIIDDYFPHNTQMLTTKTFSSTNLIDKAGFYQSKMSGTINKIEYKDNQLHYDDGAWCDPLVQIEKNKFNIKSRSRNITFIKGSRNFTITYLEGMNEEFEFITKEIGSNPVNFNEYIGIYFCSELESHYSIKLNNENKLIVEFEKQIFDCEVNLTHVLNDTFTAFNMNFFFKRNSVDNRITGFDFSTNRMRNLYFDRKQ